MAQQTLWNPSTDRRSGIVCVNCGQDARAHRAVGVFPVYCPVVIGGKGEEVAIEAAQAAIIRRASGTKLPGAGLADAWCSRCDHPSVMWVGREAVCEEHALRAAAERLVDRADNGDDLIAAIDELRDALALALPVPADEPVSDPSPEVIARAERDGTLAL